MPPFRAYVAFMAAALFWLGGTGPSNGISSGSAKGDEYSTGTPRLESTQSSPDGSRRGAAGVLAGGVAHSQALTFTALMPLVLASADLAPPLPRTWGLQFALEFLGDRHLDNVALELPRARTFGLASVRTNIPWDEIEPVDVAPEHYDWTIADARIGEYSEAGFDVIATLISYPPWAVRYGCGGGFLQGGEEHWREFVRAIAERYSRPPFRVVLWEIGNEVDGETRIRDEDFERPPGWGPGEPTVPHGGCWGDMAPEYVAFLRAAYEEIKAVDPDAKVAYGGLALQPWEDRFHLDFMDRFLEAGGSAYYDVDNYHWFAHLSDIPGQPRGPEKHGWLMAALARHGAAGRPVWLTETYRLTRPSQPETEADQVRFLTREIVEMLALPEIERVYWYGWVDYPSGIGDSDQIGRGLIRPDRTPKPATDVLAHVVAATNGVPHDESTDAVWATRFSRRLTAREYVIAWSRDQGTHTYEFAGLADQVALVRSYSPQVVMAGECCPEQHVTSVNGRFRVEIGPDPLIIELLPAQ
jgi:hypothetical protein